MHNPASFGTTLRALACLIVLIPAAAPRAEYPVEDMDNRSLGLQYGLTFRGENITRDAVPAHEILHVLSLAYSPVPYVNVEAGVGFDRFAVEPDKQVSFDGGYGVSPAFGLSLFSPALFDVLRIAAGDKAVFLNSEDGKGYRYSGLISNPFLGVIYSPSGLVDLAAGGRMLFVDGSMHAPASQFNEASPFSNRESLRGYLSVTLKSPAERAFLTVDVDVSPDLDSDWSSGPREAAVGVSFGALLGWKSNAKVVPDSSVYFPAYPEMKEKMKKMSEEIE